MCWCAALLPCALCDRMTFHRQSIGPTSTPTNIGIATGMAIEDAAGQEKRGDRGTAIRINYEIEITEMIERIGTEIGMTEKTEIVMIEGNVTGEIKTGVRRIEKGNAIGKSEKVKTRNMAGVTREIVAENIVKTNTQKLRKVEKRRIKNMTNLKVMNLNWKSYPPKKETYELSSVCNYHKELELKI